LEYHVAELTPLAVSALALLEERPMHAYEMLQLLRDRGKDAILTIKGGSLYHTMSRLADLGFAQVRSTERDGNRPERTVYELTAAGRQKYVTWVRARLQAPATPQEFAVALAEAHNLEAREVEAILLVRRAELSEHADTLRAALKSAQGRCVADAYMLEADRRLALLDCDIAWTDGVLRRLSTSDMVWSSTDPRAGLRTKEKPE
jgi:DNA-binding PadR family transcriptional regulator